MTFDEWYRSFNYWTRVIQDKYNGDPTRLNSNEATAYESVSRFNDLYKYYEDLMSGSANDYLAFQSMLNNQGLSGSAHFEKWLDNMISRQNTQDAWNQDALMRDTSLLSSANQLAQLGLSSSGVLQTGGAATPNLSSAQNVKENVALKKLQERNSMTKSILGMVGMLGSVGIHGATAAYAKKAASSLVHQTASQVFDKNGVLKATTRTKSWNS